MEERKKARIKIPILSTQPFIPNQPIFDSWRLAKHFPNNPKLALKNFLRVLEPREITEISRVFKEENRKNDVS